MDTVEPTEARSSRWQKIAAFSIASLVLGWCSLFWLQLLFPTHFCNKSVQEATGVDKAIMCIGMIWITFLGISIWRGTACFILQANNEGIRQSNGFRCISVRWSEIGSYRWQYSGRGRDRLAGPVLLDHHDRVIFRPFGNLIVSDRVFVQAKRQFWEQVTQQLDSQKGYGAEVKLPKVSQSREFCE